MNTPNNHIMHTRYLTLALTALLLVAAVPAHEQDRKGPGTC